MTGMKVYEKQTLIVFPNLLITWPLKKVNIEGEDLIVHVTLSYYDNYVYSDEIHLYLFSFNETMKWHNASFNQGDACN